MKKIHFDYCMEIVYSEPVERCHYTLKCVPVDTGRQKVERLAISLQPPNRFSRGTDSFGNMMLYGSIEVSHNRFSCHMEGEAVTGLAAYEKPEPKERLLMYRYPHGAATAGEGLRLYAQKLFGTKSVINAYEEAMELMHRLYQDFRYEKQITGLKTTAEEAWMLGCGVCQDYAHILITLCRMRGIPARYVAGLMLGEGESHAWVEILAKDGWHGLDPTNDLVVNEGYIRLGIGRDAADCALNKGILLGGGLQEQRITVKCERNEDFLRPESTQPKALKCLENLYSSKNR